MIDMDKSIFKQKDTIEAMYLSLLNEGDIGESKEYRAAFEVVCNAFNEFEKTLTPVQKSISRGLSDQAIELSTIASHDFFVSGFKLGMRLAIQSLKE
jgi:hypothetical protein